MTSHGVQGPPEPSQSPLPSEPSQPPPPPSPLNPPEPSQSPPQALSIPPPPRALSIPSRWTPDIFTFIEKIEIHMTCSMCFRINGKQTPHLYWSEDSGQMGQRLNGTADKWDSVDAFNFPTALKCTHIDN